MKIELKRVSLKERQKLELLLQLYLHDLSYYFPIPFNSKTCKFEYDLNPYFENNYAYFIIVEKNIVGFVLVDVNPDDNYEISEIFVLNGYKGKKIGEKAAIEIFQKYRGLWTIKAVPCSPVAESFWKKTINNYTKGIYKLEYTGKYNRAEFSFDNRNNKQKKSHET